MENKKGLGRNFSRRITLEVASSLLIAISSSQLRLGRALAFWKAKFIVHPPLKSQKYRIKNLGLIAKRLRPTFLLPAGKALTTPLTLEGCISLPITPNWTFLLPLESSTRDLPTLQILFSLDQNRGTDGENKQAYFHGVRTRQHLPMKLNTRGIKMNKEGQEE